MTIYVFNDDFMCFLKSYGLLNNQDHHCGFWFFTEKTGENNQSHKIITKQIILAITGTPDSFKKHTCKSLKNKKR